MRGWRAGILCLLLCTSAGCRFVLREPVTDYPSGWPVGVPWRLNRELLHADKSGPIVFLVDVVEGRDPNPIALDRLVEVASRYGGRPAEWTMLADSGLGVRWSDGPPEDWKELGHDRLRCTTPLDDETSYVFLRYAGGLTGAFGMATRAPADDACAGRTYPVILIFQDNLDRNNILWFTEKRIEVRDLIHEYGHVLGLGTNPAHGYWPDPGPHRGGAHCRNPECALALPRPRAMLYGLWYTGVTFRNTNDYCRQCRRDVEAARAFWRSGQGQGPGSSEGGP